MNKIYISQYELKHYASPYYDPVKAHEYYEAHKKLKGRTAGRTLTDKGKEAKLYVTEQIKNAKKAASEKAKADAEQAKTNRETSLNSASNRHRAEINSLQNEMLSMSSEELKRKGPMYKKKIASLKAGTAKEKAKIKQKYSDSIKAIRESNKAKQTELSNTLKAELEKMLLDNETGKDSGKGKSGSSGNVRPSSAETQARIRKQTATFKANGVSSGSGSGAAKKEANTAESSERIKKNAEAFKKKKGG